MARIKVNVVIEWVGYKIKSALEEAVQNTIPDARFDKEQLWKEFVGAINRKCSIWAKVPNSYIKK